MKQSLRARYNCLFPQKQKQLAAVSRLAIDPGELGLGLAPVGERAVLGDVLHVDAVVLEAAFRLHLAILLASPLGEPVVLAHEDLLTPGELELGTPQSLDDLSL